jgi:hypothetical protein
MIITGFPHGSLSGAASALVANRIGDPVSLE